MISFIYHHGAPSNHKGHIQRSAENSWDPSVAVTSPSTSQHLLKNEIHIGQQRQVSAARNLAVPASGNGW